MQPSDQPIVQNFDGKRQYVIPRFQRSYTWKSKGNGARVVSFWEDIIETYESKVPHFTGTIVITNTHRGTSNYPCFHVIDGQQRMITTSLLLRAFKEFVDEDTQIEIDDLLINRQDSVFGEKTKLLPSEDDRKPYLSILETDRPYSDEVNNSAVGQTFNYFYKKLNEIYKEDNGAEKIKEIYDSFSKSVHVILIDIDDGDDPSSIFQSLNAKVETLSKLSLIKNHLLLNLDAEKEPDKDYQKKFHREQWIPLMDSFGKNAENEEIALIESFFKFYLMMDGGRVTTRNLYLKFKEFIDEKIKPAKDPADRSYNQDHLLQILSNIFRDIRNNANNFLILKCRKDYESSNKNNERSIRKSIRVLNGLGIKSHTAYLLNILKLIGDESITEEEGCKIFWMIESYFVRRSIVKGLATNKTDTMFIKFCDNKIFDSQSLFDELIKGTDSGTKWPTDDSIASAFFEKPYYEEGGDNSTLCFILSEIDAHLNKKPAQKLTDDSIEHIFPQTPEGSLWEKCEDYDYLNGKKHYIGNLSVTDHNSDYLREPYAVKRKKYIEMDSHRLTREIGLKYSAWTRESMDARTTQLAKWVSEIWPRSL